MKQTCDYDCNDIYEDGSVAHAWNLREKEVKEIRQCDGDALWLSCCREANIQSRLLFSVVVLCPISRMGKLRRGDEMLMINGRSLIGMTHAEANLFLSGLPQGALQVVVAQVPEAWQVGCAQAKP